MNPACSAPSSTHSQPAGTPGTAATVVGGTYEVKGKGPDGAKYEGSVLITGDAEHGFTFAWTIGQENYSGHGTLSGNKLTVDWGEDTPVVYKVSKDGSKLDGRWGKNGKGKETLTRSSLVP